MEYPKPSGNGFPGPRRVFTAPISTSSAGPHQPSSSSQQAGAGLVETLYNHPSVKIVSFTAGPRPVFSPGKGAASQVEVEPGSLSWSSQLERTIAVGPFRIYRAPGSVAFLSCGSALQPILPKSQCWCVDEASSKYVLQIRRPQYWRIEVPVGGDEEIRNALLLREVLDKVLRFEKTECPFKRTFTVELPEPPETPVKMRPWTPVGKTFISLPPTPITPVGMVLPRMRAAEEGRRASMVESPTKLRGEQLLGDQTISSDIASEAEDLKQEILEAAETVPETVPEMAPETTPEATPDEDQETETVVDSTVPSVNLDADVVPDMSTPPPESLTQDEEATVPDEEVTTSSIPNGAKAGGFQASRVVAAPPRLSLRTSPPSKTPLPPIVDPLVVEVSQSNSPTESQDSFHSVESWTSPITPLPISPPLSTDGSPTIRPFAQDNLRVEKNTTRQDGPSDLTLTPNTPQTWIGETKPAAPSNGNDNDDSSSSHPSLPDEESSNCSASTADEYAHSPSSNPEVDPVATATSTTLTRRPFVRHRPTTSSSISPSRRALSPLPSAANLFTPRPPFRSKSTRNVNSSSSRLALVRRLPMAVVHKTVEILLSPPAHLINLMLRVAARITAGQWRGYVFGMGEGGETIPVRWDWSDDDDGCDELGGWAADEDWPYGAGNRGTPERRTSMWSPRMAGSFPESPSEDEYDDHDEGKGAAAGDRQRGRDKGDGASGQSTACEVD